MIAPSFRRRRPTPRFFARWLARILPVTLLIGPATFSIDLASSFGQENKENGSARSDDSLFDSLETEFQRDLAGPLSHFCFECHAGDRTEAEIDFERYRSLSAWRENLSLWQRTGEMLRSEQMPPAKSPQPTGGERQSLLDWIDRYLRAESSSRAGDPGPVVLRRLSNAEYTFATRDLTGLQRLAPAAEFPVDGAAGEGFTNVGDALVMSPSLVNKYLESAKVVSQHAVLLPDRIEFSEDSTRRDWTDQWLGKIQALYAESTANAGGTTVDLQGIRFDTNRGGRLPLKPYLEATLAHRDALTSGTETIESVARQLGLRTKYLQRLWTTLNEVRPQGSAVESKFLLNRLRHQWLRSTPQDVDHLVSMITAWQDTLWKFNPVGQLGRQGGPEVWMEPVQSIVPQQLLTGKLPEATSADEIVVYLRVSDIGDDDIGGDGKPIHVKLTDVMLRGGNEPPRSLRDAVALSRRLRHLRRELLSQTADYLAAAAEYRDRRGGIDQVTELAESHGIDANLLPVWLDYLIPPDTRDDSFAEPVAIAGHFKETLVEAGGYKFVRGWGSHSTPLILANGSDQEVRIPGISPAHSIVVHPSPSSYAAVAWRSPLSGTVMITAKVADAHPECGNGVEFLLQHHSRSRVEALWQGDFARGGQTTMAERAVTLRKGELVLLVIGPRQGEHTCDLTNIELTIAESGGAERMWDLATDVADDLSTANPHADRYGHPETWHFVRGEMESLDRGSTTFARVPLRSVLGRWQQERDRQRQSRLAERVRELVIGPAPADIDSADARLYRQLHTLPIPLDHPKLQAGRDGDPRFGNDPDGQSIEPNALMVEAPTILAFRLAADLVSGKELSAVAEIDARGGTGGCVQVQWSATAPDSADVIEPDVPFLVAGDQSRQRVVAALDQFRELFPAALCYARVVPVDEVVTLKLFHREDEHLQRLMLTESEIDELDRLWDELFYISQEPLQLVVALEQLSEFATQDRPDLVKAFEPLHEIIDRRASQFRKRLRASEPQHLRAVLDLADRGWRRPLTSNEKDDLRALYAAIRDDGMDHDQAIRYTLARVLTSPHFLYRREKPAEGSRPTPISDVELASRLSFFLWSSVPDEHLREMAASGRLHGDAAIQAAAVRMLEDPRAGRLAEQFACQWLHVRDFDQTVEKNEQLYPRFTELREAMYEETKRFFAAMVRENRSVLEIIDADHSFVNEPLAQHYGIEGVTGADWRRVDGIRRFGRGGVLAMSTVLASQSGASRTSPILRGNWIFETLLGERLPRPPAGVPALPDEPPQGLTARALIERHSLDPGCAKCHAKIDPYGFSLEQYDAVGRLRSETVDTRAELPDGITIEGLQGLKQYLGETRREDFLRQFSRKLLGYALGREIQLYDEPLLDQICRNLAADDYRFHTAVKTIVTSPPFRQIRGRDQQSNFHASPSP